jgi:hypothetical protein
LLLGIEAGVILGLAVHAGLHDGGQVLLATIFEPVTKAATFCSSFTFQSM